MFRLARIFRSEWNLSICSSGKNGGTKADPKDGFPGSALSAQRANDITKSYEPTANNSLGIDIQSAYLIAHHIHGLFD